MHDASIGQKIRESMMPEGLPLDLLQMAETHRIAEEAQVIEKNCRIDIIWSHIFIRDWPEFSDNQWSYPVSIPW